jgi:hypothetical protein
MLGVQTASGSEPVADRADRKRGAAQHAEGGIAERADALGVKVLAKHAAKNLPDLVDGELLLPDDHRLPRPTVAGREICWFTRLQKWPWRIRKDMPPPRLMRFFPESPLWPTDSFMSQGE